MITFLGIIGVSMSLLSAIIYIIYEIYIHELDIAFINLIKDIKLKFGPVEFTASNFEKKSPIIIVGDISSIERTIQELNDR